MMDLWLVRHGEAMAARDDPSRPLTPEGERKVAAAAGFLRGRMGAFDLMATSGKKRALQTAAIFAESAGYPAEGIAVTGALAPEALPEGFLSFLAEREGMERVLCVGHLPSIASIASMLLSSGGTVALAFGAGTVCRIRLPAVRPGAGELLLFL